MTAPKPLAGQDCGSSAAPANSSLTNDSAWQLPHVDHSSGSSEQPAQQPQPMQPEPAPPGPLRCCHIDGSTCAAAYDKIVKVRSESGVEEIQLPRFITITTVVVCEAGG